MTVFKILGSLATSFQIKSLQDKAIVDNFVFRLHYRLTSALFFAASASLTAADLFGRPIHCVSDSNKLTANVLNTYCWIQQTFTLIFNNGSLPHAGVGPESGWTERRFHSYYQWVPFVLFFQGILFYVPHGIWKRHEGGMIGRLTDGVRGLNLMSNQDDKHRRSVLADYLNKTMGTHGHLGVVHVTCELFNMVNAVGNIYLIDLFLGGTFFDYGWKIFQYSELDQENRNDRLIQMFPRVTKCIYHRYGSSGTIETLDAMCILPLNVVNEKIYIFVWFWLIVLSLFSISALLYRVVVVMSSTIRRSVFKRIVPTGDVDSITRLCRTVSYADCYLLFMLGKNLPSEQYRDLLNDLVIDC